MFYDDGHVLRTLTKPVDASTAHLKLGDIARGGHVLVNIRKFTDIPFRALGELVERDMLSPQVAAFLRACVRARLSIVFAGPPGSGKTTLLSCSTAELDPGLRVVVAEEVFESDVPVPNVAQMQTRAARPDRPEVDLRRLVAGFLRMTPDVAIVGDVRDRERFRTSLTLSKVEFDACPRDASAASRPVIADHDKAQVLTREPNSRVRTNRMAPAGQFWRRNCTSQGWTRRAGRAGPVS